MARFALGSWMAVTLLACGFDTGGVMSGSASIGSAGDDDTGAADDVHVDDGPGTGQEAEGESADPSTTGATDDPTADDGDPTTNPTLDSTTGDTLDPSTDGSDGTTDPSGGTTMGVDPSTTGTDDGTPTTEYPNCSGPNMCAAADEDCLQFFIDGNVVANLCMPPCTITADCPPVDSGNAVPFCDSGFCRLSCDAGESCPTGMTCHNVMGPELCAYDL